MTRTSRDISSTNGTRSSPPAARIPELRGFNSTSKTFPLDVGSITQWFVPTTDAQDLEFARKLISAAKNGIMFLFFNPGAFAGPDKPAKQWTLLQNILARDHGQVGPTSIRTLCSWRSEPEIAGLAENRHVGGEARARSDRGGQSSDAILRRRHAAPAAL